MWEIIVQNLPTILTALIATGVIWKYLSKVLVLIKEVSDLLTVTLIAMADKELTADELAKIIKEASDIPKAIAEFINTKKKSG